MTQAPIIAAKTTTPEEPTVARIHALAKDELSKLGHHGEVGADQMFRQLAERVRLYTQTVRNKDIAIGDYVGRLSYFGGNLLRNLHGHHGWEDHSYFPELSAADPRFEAGLALLEQDHVDLDLVLDDMSRKANRVI